MFESAVSLSRSVVFPALAVVSKSLVLVNANPLGRRHRLLIGLFGRSIGKNVGAWRGSGRGCGGSSGKVGDSEEFDGATESDKSGGSANGGRPGL